MRSASRRLAAATFVSLGLLAVAVVSLYVVRERGGVWGGVRALMPWCPVLLVFSMPLLFGSFRGGGRPWPRTVLAGLVGEIARKGGAVIGFDMLFPEADRTSPPVAADTFQGIDEATRETLRRLPSNDQVLADAFGYLGRQAVGPLQIEAQVAVSDRSLLQHATACVEVFI